MEEILDLYAEPKNPLQPVVNVDEAMKQMIADTREPIPASPVKQKWMFDLDKARAKLTRAYEVLNLS